jgi:hypothetical protein
VAEWVSNNLGKAAEAFGKVFPLCVSSNFTEPGMVIATAIQARAVTSRALLPIRVRRCVALRRVAMCCDGLRWVARGCGSRSLRTRRRTARASTT